MSTCFENTTKATLIQSISNIITEIIKENQEKSIIPNHTSPFFTDKVPKVSLITYLERVIKYTNIEKSTIIISLYYVDMYCKKANDPLCMNNIHR